MSAPKIDLIRQALSASESSIRLARQLLSELEREVGKNKHASKDTPGITGFFDGQNMVTEKGEKFSVPENYASKSILVVGDTLKLAEEGGNKRFKQIEHVKRHKTSGILTKKDGKWAAVTSEGSYKIIPAAVAHFNGEVGDEVLLQIPANNLQSSWAALEKVSKKASGGDMTVPAEKTELKDEKKTEKPVREVETKEAKTETKEAKPKEEKEKTKEETKAEVVKPKEKEEKPKIEEVKKPETPEPAVEETKEKEKAQEVAPPSEKVPEAAVPEATGSEEEELA